VKTRNLGALLGTEISGGGGKESGRVGVYIYGAWFFFFGRR